MQNNDLEQKIAALPFESMKELKALWQSYFNEAAPVFNKATLVQKLAYRMQELEYGGLKSDVREQLKDMASGGKLKPRRKFKMKIRPPAGKSTRFAVRSRMRWPKNMVTKSCLKSQKTARASTKLRDVHSDTKTIKKPDYSPSFHVLFS